MNTAAGTVYAPVRIGVPASDAPDAAGVWFDEITKLYLLSFLLTANKMMAERCFSGAMDDYVVSFGVTLGDWVKGSGRAAVIVRAVQMAGPVPKRVHGWSFIPGSRPLVSAAHQPFSAITALSVFERFVFVITVLEGYSAEECAGFLECTLDDISAALDVTHRLSAVAETETGLEHSGESQPLTAALVHQRSAIC